MENKIAHILKSGLNLDFDSETFAILEKWEKLFLEYNSHTNLMSKNDVGVLFEKHVFDSLAITKWNEFSKVKSILDVGTGGGFPSLILAICFPEKKIFANDSRIKKINFLNMVKSELKLDNLEVIYARCEEIEPLNVDLVVSRAVGKIVDVFEISSKHIKQNTHFLIYKSKNVQEEIDEFKNRRKNIALKIVPKIIPYSLPLETSFERCLVVF